MAKYDEKREKVSNMGKVISYDKENDILVVHRGYTSDEKYKGNIDVGDIVLDVSTNGKIRGIEVFNASQFLKSFVEKGNEESILNKIIDADFNTTVKPNGIIISLVIKSKNQSEVPATIAVPLEKPILSR